MKCFGHDAIETAFNRDNGSNSGRDGSIFAAFARQGQAPVTISHRAHTTDETRCTFIDICPLNYLTHFRAHMARWCAESTRLLKIVEDREFSFLMRAGRSGIALPKQKTIGQDIQLAFEKCRMRIDQILRVRC